MSQQTRSPLLAAASKMLGGSVLVVILQALNFLLLARVLGASEFGKVAAINAIAAILIPMSGLGFGNILLMNVSRDRSSAAASCGNGLLVQFATGLLATGLGCVVSMVVIGNTSISVLAAAVLACELMLLRTATLATQYFSATGNFSMASGVNIATSIVRLTSIVAALLIWGTVSATNWALGILLISTVYAFLLILLLRFECGALHTDCKQIISQLNQGFSFSFGTVAKAIYTDGDKTILSRTSSIESVGLYASAYRLTAMAFMPVRAILDASASNFFREGQQGLKMATKLSFKLMFYALPYSLIAGLALYLIAPWIDFILGPSYSGTENIVKMLALLPAIQTIHYLLSDALTGANFQGLRSKLQMAVVIEYLAIGLYLIPEYGTTGAIITCVASEATLALLVSGCIFYLLRKSKPSCSKST